MALVGDPELLFLDEPTTGFDPSARRQAWDVIAGLRDLGKTVFLTTHYMDEAQRLADRVTIIAAGRIVARGTPADLGQRGSGETTIRYRVDGREVSLRTTEPVKALNELTGRALADGQELEGLEVTRPSLEDVYLELTEAAETEVETAAAEETTA
jgi:ABC-2 type transport system ATP-binding protein